MSEKKRSAPFKSEKKKKGYRITCVIDKIEEFDLGAGDEEKQIVIVTTDTIGSIEASCVMNMKSGKRQVTLKGVDNLIITPNPNVEIWARDMGGMGGIKILM